MCVGHREPLKVVPDSRAETGVKGNKDRAPGPADAGPRRGEDTNRK